MGNVLDLFEGAKVVVWDTLKAGQVGLREEGKGSTSRVGRAGKQGLGIANECLGAGEKVYPAGNQG